MSSFIEEENNKEKSKEITKFHSNIRRLYKLIDKSSCLLWNHNNHITIGKKKQFDAEENFFNIETTQLGYGEISITSMTQLFNFLMNIDTFLSQEDESLIESYNLTKDSYFLDIGSGFGKPVFHCAYQVGCICQGIEVVPARVEFCVDFYFGFSDGRNDLPEEIIYKENKTTQSKNVYKKKKKGKRKSKSIANVRDNIYKNLENLKLKKYIDFNQLFNNNLSFKYDWFNLYNFGYNFCINPDYEDLIWSLHLPLIKYENYKNIDEIKKEIYFFLKNYYDNEEYIISYLTNIFYEINNRSILLLTNNEIEYNFEEPFPNIKTKIIENEKNINIDTKLSENIINNLYKSSTNNYIPLIDSNDSSYESIYENIHLLDFLNFINDNTSIEYHDYIPENNINNILNCKSYNNSSQNLLSTTNNEMIIEEELIKREEENNTITNTNNDINISNNYLIDMNQEIPKNTNILKYLQNKLTFNPHDSQFKCSFLCNDATKYDDYHYNPPFDTKKEVKHPFTHIYSYNKLMGDTCKEKVCEILNNSDWKVLAWYTNERQTRESGLENFKFVASFPMTSTGNQKFSCYVYIKKYD